MRFGDLLRVGGVGLRTRPLRAFLSALGIAIGIAAMVSVVGISSSSRAEVERTLDALDDHARSAGGGLGDAQGEVVGLAPRAGKHHVADILRHHCKEALGIVEDGVRHVAGVRVEDRRLPGNGRDDPGMAMADAGDIVVGVEIGLPVRTMEPDPFGAHDVQGARIE